MKSAVICALLAALAPVTGAELRAQQIRSAESTFGSLPLALTVRMGTSRLGGGGDVFGTFRRELSLSESAFDAGLAELELSAGVSDRIDLFIGGTMRRAQQASTQAWGDVGGPDANEQTTRLEVTPGVYVGGRLFAFGRLERGAARTPRSANPYVTLGVGRGAYSLRQWGRFVDRDTGEDFEASFTSNSGYLRAFVGAGIDFALSQRLSVTMDARREFASATPEGDFQRFESLSLSGSVLALGIRWGW